MCPQAFVLTEGDAVGEDRVDAVVHVGFVINLVGDYVDGLQLVGVTGGKYDFLGVVLAVPLDLGEHLNVRKIYLVEDNGVVSRVVKFGHSLGGIIGHAHRKKGVQCHTVVQVVLG